MLTCPGCASLVTELSQTCPGCGASLPVRFRRIDGFEAEEVVFDHVDSRTVTLRARDVETGVVVALTVFKPEAPPSQEDLTRLRDDAETCRSLTNPHVACTRGFFHCAEGYWYRVRDWSEHRDAKDVWTANGWDHPEATVAAMIEAADALASMRRDGLRLPYLIPDDLWFEMGPDGAEWFPRFNYRTFRFLGGRPAERLPGEIEQLLKIHPDVGDSGILGPSADLFSLGYVFHYLMTGLPPSLADSRLTILDPPGPAPEKLRRVIANLLSRNPDDRWDADRVAAELRSISAEDWRRARDEDRTKRLAASSEHGRTKASTIAAVFLVVAAGAVFLAFQKSAGGDFVGVFQRNRGAIYALTSRVDGEDRGFCTAFAVDPSGLLLTNAHCVVTDAFHKELEDYQERYESALAVVAMTGGEEAIERVRSSAVDIAAKAAMEKLGHEVDFRAQGMDVRARRTDAPETEPGPTVVKAWLHPDFDLAAEQRLQLKLRKTQVGDVPPSEIDVLDLALLQVAMPEGSRLEKVVTLADTAEVVALREGSELGTIGFPFGFGAAGNVSPVSAVGHVTNARCLEPPIGETPTCRSHFLHQTDTEPGTSGSPFFDRNGNVVAMVVGRLPGVLSDVDDDGPRVSLLATSKFGWAVRIDAAAQMLSHARQGIEPREP
jgi:S1-C subfamily serine protease